MNTTLRKLNSISKEDRFYLLLAAIFIYLLFEFFGPRLGGMVFIRATMASVLLIAAIGCLRFQKMSFLNSRIFGVLVIALAWIDAAIHVEWFSIVDSLFRIVFFMLVTGALIYQVAKTERVSLSVIVGAISGYFLLGIAGSVAAMIVEGLAPGAFGMDATAKAELSTYIYYSYITLATVGYGDITPVAPAARFLSIILGVSGRRSSIELFQSNFF